jgi:hypothetical protein
MAEENFVFIWDEQNQVWVAGTSTKDRRRKTQSLPIDADLIPGARRVIKGNREILYIPKSRKEELYRTFPDFKPQKDIVRKGVKKSAEVVKEGTKAVVEPIERVSPDIAPAIKETAEIKPASLSVGESIGKSFKTEEVPVGAPLPGSNREPLKTPVDEEQRAQVGVTGAPGAVRGGLPAGQKPKNVIVGLDVSQDFAGDPSQPVDQTKRSVLESGEIGLFSIQNNPAYESGTYLFLGDEKTGAFSRPVEQSRFRADLYKLSPQEVIEYKKALGYRNPTPAKDVKFINDVFAKAQEVSEFNYYSAASGGREQIGVKSFITNPEKYGAIIAGAGGVTVSAEELRAKTETVRLLATELGVTLSEDDVRTLASQYAKGAIDANTIKYQVARAGEIDFTSGTAAATIGELQALAGSYGLTVSDAFLQTAVKNVITGNETIDTVKNDFKTQAKMLYPTLADSIEKGYTPRQLSGSYLNYLASIRGVSADSISLDDPFMTRALTSLNDKGQPEQLPYWKFQEIVRTEDPSYPFSKDAEVRAVSLLDAFGKTFGKSWSA